MQIYKFRDCLLNAAERSVIKGDAFVELTTKTFDVLEFLIENAGRIVTKDELLGKVWIGNFVEESNLPVHISKFRKIKKEPTYFRTPAALAKYSLFTLRTAEAERQRL